MKIPNRITVVPAAATMLMICCGLALSCGAGVQAVQPEATESEEMKSNPLLGEFNTPFEVPPFERIELGHFLPAYLEGMAVEQEEIAKIATLADPPTFKNTIETFDRAGLLLARVDNIFNNLNASTTSDEMQAVAKEVAPLLARHADDIYLNEDLFARIRMIHDNRANLGLNSEQERLLGEIYRDFVRGGANLPAGKKERFRAINEDLSVSTLQFGENVLNEAKAFKLVIENKDDLAGLPDSQIDTAADAATTADLAGKWLFTIDKSSLIPFLQFSQRRELREKMFTAYINQGNHGDKLDNKGLIKKIVSQRIERADMLGFETHADFVLDVNMAKTPKKVYELLDEIWEPAAKVAKREAKELSALARKEGGDFELKPWDWWYFAEKLREEKYDLKDEELRPYFELENVRKGAFDVATRLWGLEFVEREDLPKYHEDVRSFEVREANGAHIGIFYVDYYTRSGTKRGGAWMSAFRKQWGTGDDRVTPVITNNCNFQKPAQGKPSLLSFEEVETLFHEFGHALHGLLSNSNYRTLSGTSVARDFVELPSQIMENWAGDPEVLGLYAKHHKTGETIPKELIEKINRSALFNQGFVTVEYLAASYLDMDWHTQKEMTKMDPMAFEERSLNRIGLIPEIVVRYRSPYFRHIFSGVVAYSAGYYSYVWAQVLDADAFSAFKETDLFDQEKARSFRENILSAGNTADPMELYRRFRGKEPSIDALLKRKGLVK
jgi:peptidyl-dipeptidase Dcp